MRIEDFIPEHTRQILCKAGLHKIAGAMAGVDELTIKEAAQLIGMKAYQRRTEMRKIAQGLRDLAALESGKTADFSPVLEKALMRSLFPALGGAAIGALPSALSDDPAQKDKMLQNALIGGGLGAIGGMGRAIHRGSVQAPAQAQAFSAGIT